MSGIFNADFYPTPPEVAALMLDPLDLKDKTILEPSAGSGSFLSNPPFAMNTTTIYSGPADGWHLAISARPAMGCWALKFAFTSDSGRTKLEHTAWSRSGGWNPTVWQPLLGSQTRTIAEAWLLANPVPVPGRVVTATVVPGLDFRGVKP